MPFDLNWGAFFVATLILVLIPGPSLLFTLGRALSAGRHVAVLSVLGNATGLLVQVTLVALGLGPIVAASATAYTALKVLGAGYLIYLGVQSIRHRRDAASALDAIDKPPIRWVHAWRDGLIVGVTNPKTVVFFISLLPQFVNRGAGPVWAQLLALGLFFCLVAAASDSLVAMAAGTARDWFARSPRRLGRLGAAGGAMMIGLAAVLLITGRPADASSK